MLLSVSFLKSKYDLNKTISLLNNTNCDYIHFDYMNNTMVNNESITIKEFNNLKINKPVDIHLMVDKPYKYINKLKHNIEYITYHYNQDKNNKTYNKIKKRKIKVGIAIKPDEDVKKYSDILNKYDLILLLSVNPGYGGQEFIKETIEKLNYLIQYRQDNNLNYKISIDGGINDKTIKYLKDKNIDIVISGSFICNNDNYQDQINKLFI